MTNKEDRKATAIIILFTALFIAVAIAFIFFFFHSIALYFKFDVEYNDLLYEKLTFVQYEKIRMGKGGHAYKFYFKEYEEPFLIDNITIKRVDGTALSNLTKNGIVEVYYWESSNRNYEYEICEISSQKVIPLSLDDYIAANQDNQLVGIFFTSPIMIFLSLFLAWFFVRTLRPRKSNNGLGKMRIEHMINGDVIRIYHSIQVCSLVINDKIFDQHYGEYASNYKMKGMVKSDGKVVRVEVKMGQFYMCLYCNGKLVAKKFMLFG